MYQLLFMVQMQLENALKSNCTSHENSTTSYGYELLLLAFV